MSNGIYARPEKEDNAATVLYEIDMLRFAYDRLRSPHDDGWELWICLEVFLLHYRNLIEFFGKQNPRDGDLSIREPENLWYAELPDRAALAFMTKPELWEKYDSGDNPESISKYLHHCTEFRTAAKSWDTKTMFEEIKPIIDRFESLFPERIPKETATRGIGTEEIRLRAPEGSP